MKLIDNNLLEQVATVYKNIFNQAGSAVGESEFSELRDGYNDFVDRFNPFLIATGKIPTPPEPAYTFVTVPTNTVTIKMNQWMNNAFTIDWGDGNTEDTDGKPVYDYEHHQYDGFTLTHNYTTSEVQHINITPNEPDNELCVGEIDGDTDDTQFTEVNLENLSWYISGNDTITKMTINSYIQMFGCGTSMLYDCSALTELKIGNKVQNAMFEPISECTALRKVTIDSNENFVMLFLASYECRITEIHCLSTTPFSLSDDGVAGNPTSGTDTEHLVIYVPASAVDTYKAANVWSDYAQYIQAEA